MANYLNFEEVFKTRNPQYEFLLSRMRCAMEVDEVKFSDINTINLRRFKDYMEGEVSNNSLRTYMAVLKAAINEMVSDGLISNAKCVSVLKAKAEPQQNVSLTDEEIKKLENYYECLLKTSGNQIEKGVLTLFLIEIFTGARGVDVENFTLDNINENKLTYVSKKTHTLTVLPAHHKLKLLIKNMPNREFSRMTKNRTIKRIAKLCGINQLVNIYYHGRQRKMPKYEFVAFHTARRSFVSNLIERGVPISAVSKLAGHKNINMTQRYFVTQDIQLDDKAMAFFND